MPPVSTTRKIPTRQIKSTPAPLAQPRKIASPPQSSRKTVLIAVLGSTPAVLTEALWALAHEAQPLVPDNVVVITTTHGANTLQTQLLTSRSEWNAKSVWQAFRQTLLGKGHAQDTRLTLGSPIVVHTADPKSGTTRPLDDIRSPGDNEAAAETILSTVRGFTTDSDSRVLGLLAGGRKTMGALLHASLSLAGRADDRLLHVLVNEPFDHPRLNPTFFFPGQPGAVEHSLPEGRAVSHSSVKIELTDVPLVALGELIFARTGKAPATFAALTRAANAAVGDATSAALPIELAYDEATYTLTINGLAVVLPKGRCSTLVAQLWERARADAEYLRNAELFDVFDSEKITFEYNGKPQLYSKEDVNRALNELRDAINNVLGNGIRERLLPLRSPIGFNREGVVLLS